MNYKNYIESLLERKTDFSFYRATDDLYRNWLTEALGWLGSLPEQLTRGNLESMSDYGFDMKRPDWDSAQESMNPNRFKLFMLNEAKTRIIESDAGYSYWGVYRIGDIDLELRNLNSDDPTAYAERKNRRIVINYFRIKKEIFETMTYAQLFIWQSLFLDPKEFEWESDFTLDKLKRLSETIVKFLKSQDVKVAFFHEIKHIDDQATHGIKAFDLPTLKDEVRTKLDRGEITKDDIGADDWIYTVPEETEKLFREKFLEVRGTEPTESQMDYLKYFSRNHETNGFFVNIMIMFLDFLDERGTDGTPGEIVRSFLSKFSDRSTDAGKTIQDWRITGVYEKMVSRLTSFLAELRR